MGHVHPASLFSVLGSHARKLLEMRSGLHHGMLRILTSQTLSINATVVEQLREPSSSNLMGI